MNELNGIKDRIRELELKKQEFGKNIPRNYHNIKDLNTAIKKKQQDYETGTMSNVQEK